ncbi:hypothetical protein D3C72_1873070 [compost metagenome]
MRALNEVTKYTMPAKNQMPSALVKMAPGGVKPAVRMPLRTVDCALSALMTSSHSTGCGLLKSLSAAWAGAARSRSFAMSLTFSTCSRPVFMAARSAPSGQSVASQTKR